MQTLWRDCQGAARQITGVANPQENSSLKAIVYNNQGREWSPRTENPKNMAKEVLKNEYNISRNGALMGPDPFEYHKNSQKAVRKNLAERTQINEHADPSIGEGWVIVKTDDREGFPFHWGIVIMSSGNDRVTLESYADLPQGQQKDNDLYWTFRMYGPSSKKQTFHQRHYRSNRLGKDPITLRVRKVFN